MKWRGRRVSANIEDRRDLRGATRARRSRSGGVKGIGAIAILLIGAYFGVDTSFLLDGGGGGAMNGGGVSSPEAPAQPEIAAAPNAIDDRSEEFAAVVLADTEEVWQAVFAEHGMTYEAPTLVLFSGSVRSACGSASAASGPFYCPADRKAFLDTDFFRVLSDQLGATGDFASAYVIAHEVAHHVQNLLGILPQVDAARRLTSEVEANRLTVRLELQADCFSGVWARRAAERFGSLEPGDVDEALNAASRIGDDALQRRAQGYVVPDSFTHGTSEQRRRWFANGFERGEIADCDTFKAERL